MTPRFKLVSCLAAAALALPLPAIAQDSDDDEASDLGNIIVTATRIRQGGAQDIKHFRSVSLNGDFLPPADSLTLEGLMGEHDLTLPSQRECKQLFCISAHSMAASLPGRPQDELFVGLGFESGVDADAYRGEPLSLIAVVDRSGSMSDEPIARVKEGLRAALLQMRRGDRMGIVIYGDDTVVHLPVIDVAGNQARIQRAIDSIEIDGSTYMEAGLKLGYATAFEELERSRGKTRLMLFTDENPNVGDTSAEGFMGLAVAGSQRGVGLTTIGVGVHYDGELASKVASARGGNLFFLDTEGSAARLFEKEFFNMVGEVAHDVAITIDPADGYKVTGVFGVPDNLMTEAPDGTITVTIGSAFLSSNGGGIYASLGKDGSRSFLPAAGLNGGSPATVSVAYTDAITNKTERDAAVVAPVNPAPPERLMAAHMLVDEYLTLTDALAAYHRDGDKKGAFTRLDALSKRMEQVKLARFDGERTMIAGLRDRAAWMAGYRGEVPKSAKPLAVVGEWRVLRHKGVDDLSVGDRIAITSDGEFITYRTCGRDAGAEIEQEFEVNENQLRILDTDLVLRYTFQGDRLRMNDRSGAEILLERETVES